MLAWGRLKAALLAAATAAHPAAAGDHTAAAVQSDAAARDWMAAAGAVAMPLLAMFRAVCRLADTAHVHATKRALPGTIICA